AINTNRFVMKDLEIIGVPRNKKFSPNHVGNDDAIFSLTIKELEKQGYRVQVYREDEFASLTQVPQKAIFTMAREKHLLKKLQALEVKGTVVVNSGFGIERCFRTNMTRNLISNNIPYPKSFVVPTSYTGDNVFDQLTGKGYWIKRGDFHAIHKEDVTFAASRQEARDILREYQLRDIPDAVISEHLHGDLVKFYAVRGTNFFYWFYPYDHNHHKYADYEAINGKSLHHAFNEAELQRVATASAEALGIYIYGGDAIVNKDGSFHMIDVNDWPSFAPCRDQAAPYIAELLIEKFTNTSNEFIRYANQPEDQSDLI
ncbi:MAG: hypothetical protein QM669_14690, partial [Siphonobacter sp.]